MKSLVRGASMILALMAAGCGGGSSGGGDGSGGARVGVNGLRPPTSVSIIVPDDADVGADALINESDLPAGCDYLNDEVRLWIFDPSMEALGTINDILCLTGQTKADVMVNQGVYAALINAERCEQGSSDGGGGGSRSSGSATELEYWVVDSDRTTNTASQTIQFWVPNDDDRDGRSQEPLFIHAEMVIEESASLSNPFGSFYLNFAMAPDGADLETESQFVGTLRTEDSVGSGLLGFSFFEESGDFDDESDPEAFASRTQVSVQMTRDKTEGVAHVIRNQRGNFGGGGVETFSEEYLIAFNETHVLRKRNNEDPVCLSRESFNTSVWRTNLYDAETGDQVELNSGFGFQTDDGEWGWMGYYGYWLPGDEGLETGDVITRRDHENESNEDYTMLISPGRLIQFMKNTLALEEIEDVDLEWWDPGYWDQETENHVGGGLYLVRYNDEAWARVSSMDDEGSWEDLEEPETIDLDTYGFLNMWSQGLGGSVFYADGEEVVTFYEQEFVGPDSEALADGDLTFYGFFDALRAGITEEEANAGDVYFDFNDDLENPYEYVFDSDGLTLSYDSDRVGLVDGAEPTGFYEWGLRSGPMITADQLENLENPHDIWLVDEFYVYETGHNPWNQNAIAVDSEGNAVSFDPPLQFSYTHLADNDRNASERFSGQTFLLQYHGSGDLGGFPYSEIDFDDDGHPDRWLPGVNLIDGLLLGPSGEDFIVRAIEMEQTLQRDPDGCEGLSLTLAEELRMPDGDDYETPEMGSRPVVTDPPAVIDGVVQD